MAPTALLFDLDGTLWNSAPWYSDVLGAAAFRDPREVLALVEAGENIVNLTRAFGVSDNCFARACNPTSLSRILFPRVLQTLKELRFKRVPLGVVTNLPKRIAQPMLEGSGIAEFMSAMVFAARKPSPSGLVTALKDLKVRAGAEAYYVGDTQSDADAAGKVPLPFAWVDYGNIGKPPNGTTLQVSTFSDLLAL